MKVLLLTDQLRTGGAETYFCKLENHVNHRALTVYTAASAGELSGKLKDKQRFFPLSKSHRQNIQLLRKKVIEFDISIIHANSLRMTLYAIIIQQLVRQKLSIVYTKHNVTILEQKAPWLFAAILNKWVNCIVTVSDYEKQNLLQLGVHHNLICTIYNGVDLQQFPFSKKQSTPIQKVGILARLSEEKNHRLFLQIAAELQQERELSFYIAGDGPERAAIMAMCRELKLKNVHLLGEVQQPEVFIQSMDLLLLTSKREVFPMVMLEAMAMGTPMLSINVGGIREAIIDQETGFLVHEWDAKAFAAYIRCLRFDESLKGMVIRAAREKVEKQFTLAHMIAATTSMYQDVCVHMYE